MGIKAVREISEVANRRANTEHSYTFHGRDVYAYTGAKLASGHISFEEVGPELSVDKIVEIPTVPTEVGSDYVKVQLIFWMFDLARFGPRLRGRILHLATAV